jgi:hypothetical protein
VQKVWGKWHRGHKCAESIQLNVIQEVWDLLESKAPYSPPDQQSDVQSEQAFMAISEAAISGSEGPRTLKIKGLIQGIEVLMLIDSGSSHSFVSEQVATLLEGITASRQSVKVKVANGQFLYSRAELPNAIWSIQGYQF